MCLRARARYFSVWEAEDPTPQGGSNNPKLQADWVNFLFTGADPTVLRSYHKETGMKSLLAVRGAFFCGNKLCPDYKKNWATLLESTVKPMLADGSIFGVFFGDEICWSCTPWADVNTAGENISKKAQLSCALVCCSRSSLTSAAVCSEHRSSGPAARQGYIVLQRGVPRDRRRSYQRHEVSAHL